MPNQHQVNPDSSERPKSPEQIPPTDSTEILVGVPWSILWAHSAPECCTGLRRKQLKQRPRERRRSRRGPGRKRLSGLEPFEGLLVWIVSRMRAVFCRPARLIGAGPQGLHALAAFSNLAARARSFAWIA